MGLKLPKYWLDNLDSGGLSWAKPAILKSISLFRYAEKTLFSQEYSDKTEATEKLFVQLYLEKVFLFLMYLIIWISPAKLLYLASTK